MKKPRARPSSTYAIKRGGEIDLNNLDKDRDSVVHGMNISAGEFMMPVSVSEIAAHPRGTGCPD